MTRTICGCLSLFPPTPPPKCSYSPGESRPRVAPLSASQSPPLAWRSLRGGCLCSAPSPPTTVSASLLLAPCFLCLPSPHTQCLGPWLSWRDLLSLFQSVCTMHSVTAPEPCASSCHSLNHFRLPASLPPEHAGMLLIFKPKLQDLVPVPIPWLFFGGKGPHG